MKKNKDFQKVFSKNHTTMNAIVRLKADLFMPTISDIRKRFGINKDLPTIDPMENQNQYGNLIKQGSKKMKTFHERIGDRAPDFYADLKKITKQFNLGREWITPLEKFAISGIFLPPPFSVFVNENENEQIIIFELNKNTTKYDLDLAWKNIKDIRKKMFNKVRANFPTEKGIDNFKKVTEYQTIKNADKNAVDTLENNSGYKKTSLDIIGEVYSSEDVEDFPKEEVDKNRLNKLKVAKHRLKKVTS